jgi:hypothetical protein
MMRHCRSLVLGAVALACVSSAVLSQTAGTSPAPAAPQPEYHPSMGDLMTMAVQPRHTKLGIAGRQKNWTYAAYELSELRNAFARVGRTIPIYRTTDTAALLDGMTREPLAALEKAIHDADANRFESAYASLTAACNACHRSQEHAMVVIKVPRGEPYPDQEFGR